MASTIWKGYITFGLISLPVRLTVAARSETISFNQLHKEDNSRVKQVLYCITEDKPVARTDLVKGFEYEEGRYVVVDEEDLKKIQPKSAKVIEILEFVEARDVDSIYLESSYYLQPEEAGEKAYTVLFEALKRTNRYGVAKVTMHNREHVVILRPGKRGLMLHTMYYPDEVRASDEFRTDSSAVKEPEVAMAQQLIEALVTPFDPSKYSDSYRTALRAMIDAKISGQQVVQAPPAQELAPVIDIMEALQKSLVAVKKPPVTEKVAAAVPKRRRAGG
jgi:DNA end-binding protein Ku